MLSIKTCFIFKIKKHNTAFQWEKLKLNRDSNHGPTDFYASVVLIELLYSTDGISTNLPLESNVMQGFVVCDTVCHHLTGERTSSLLI